jgi:hypothetical protein
MNARVILISALVILLCAACQQNVTPSTKDQPTEPAPSDPSPTSPKPADESADTPQMDPDVAEYAVYNDLLEDQYADDGLDQILIMDQTQVHSPGLLEQDLESFQTNTPLSPELISSFKQRNQQPYQLKPILDFGVKYQLMTQEDVDELKPLDEASGWKLFYEKFPNSYGFVSLSRVGFNADFSQALVYIESNHYDQPIKGGYYLMVKQDGRWVIESGFEWMT